MRLGGAGGRIRTCEALAEDLEPSPFDHSGTPAACGRELRS